MITGGRSEESGRSTMVAPIVLSPIRQRVVEEIQEKDTSSSGSDDDSSGSGSEAEQGSEDEDDDHDERWANSTNTSFNMSYTCKP